LRSTEQDRLNLALAFDGNVGKKCPQGLPENVSSDEIGIVSIEVPVNSSNAQAWPLDQHRWKVDFPLEPGEAVGIGHIIDEGDVTPQTASSTSFSMHDRRSVGPHVPDEKLANVTYTFSSPVEVSEVKLIQHTNGVTQIEGYAGDPIDTLTSIGKTWSTI